MSASNAPGVLDPRAHYARHEGGVGPSDMERKMQLMVAMTSGDSDGEEEDGADDSAERGNASALASEASASDAAQHGPLSVLPIEIMERILTYATTPAASFTSQVAETDDVMRSNMALGYAARLCLVSKQFDALVRPIMYRRIRIAHRKTRAFLRSLEGSNAKLATYVRDLTLESRIWTSDVNEDTIARVLVAVRRYVVRLHVGANESALLPYLFYGHPRATTDSTSTSSSDSAGDAIEPAALQALHICWRDEVDFDPARRRPRRPRARAPADGAVAAEVNGNGVISDAASSDGETDDDAVRDTLRSLFEHDYGDRSRASSREQDCRSMMDALANLQHLTLDLVTHAQLAQLFLSSGYFVQHVLPQLELLRVELPLAVLQFAAPVRGAVAHQWPCKRWRLHSRNIEDMLSDRIEQNRSVTVDYAVQQERRRSDPHRDLAGASPFAHHNGQTSFVYDSDKPNDAPASQSSGNIVLAACADYQLKALLQRFALNVHKNDTTLFEVLLAPTRALDEKTWSSRAAIAAYCLKATLEKRLNSATSVLTSEQIVNHTDSTSDPSIIFPLATFQAQGVPHFWRTQWEEADAVYAAYLPMTTGGTFHTSQAALADAATPSAGKDTLARRQESQTQHAASKPHVAILLKWPTAQEAFFHHSAMV